MTGAENKVLIIIVALRSTSSSRNVCFDRFMSIITAVSF